MVRESTDLRKNPSKVNRDNILQIFNTQLSFNNLVKKMRNTSGLSAYKRNNNVQILRKNTSQFNDTLTTLENGYKQNMFSPNINVPLRYGLK